jgi:hypothetical protein
MKLPATRKAARSQGATTFIEVLVGTALMGIMFASFYSALSAGFSMVRVTRENLRATQIALNRMEGLRLYNWNQLVHSNMIPTSFTENYFPLGASGNTGITFHGTMTISNACLNPPTTYDSGMMRHVTVRVTWTSSGVEREAQMSTYVSQYGMQNYLFSN